MVSVVLIRYYNMLWRIQPISGLEMGVSYVWVASVVVRAFVYMYGDGSCVSLLNGIPQI